MKAALEIELFGDDTRQYCKLWKNIMNEGMLGLGDVTIGTMPSLSWVAEITGKDQKYKYARKFLKGKKDYSRANSKGSRGIFMEYLLESEHYYEVSAQISWKNIDRYFCTVDNEGNIVRIDEAELPKEVERPVFKQLNAGRNIYYAALGMTISNPSTPQQRQIVLRNMAFNYDKVQKCLMMMMEKLSENDIIKSLKAKRFTVASTLDMIYIGCWTEMDRALTMYNCCADIIKTKKLTHEIILEGVQRWLKSRLESTSSWQRDSE